MHNVLIIFSIMLVLLTVVSALGGSIRFENYTGSEGTVNAFAVPPASYSIHDFPVMQESNFTPPVSNDTAHMLGGTSAPPVISTQLQSVSGAEEDQQYIQSEIDSIAAEKFIEAFDNIPSYAIY